MDEANLMKERLQAITDKRRIQENIAIKRREIEEEKLKLQYMKKKALREQWLMDGLTQQSEEEQEATRIQARYEQQQSEQLQSNIFRIEKEIEALETMELKISTNEEVVVKRLKEVERKTEDIVKNTTSVDGEADEKVLSKDCSTKNYISPSVTMETAEQSELLMVCEEADSPEHGKDFSAHNKQVCIESDQSDSPEENTKGGKLSSNLQADFSETVHTKIFCQDQKEALLLESVHENVNMNESITSSPFERLSSIHSACGNDVHCRSQDTAEQDSQQEAVSEQNIDRGQVPEPDINTAQEQDPEPGIYSELEQDPEPERNSDLEKHPESDQDPELEGDLEPELYLELVPEVEDTELNPQGHTYQNLTEALGVPEEPILELCIREETMSDGSNDDHNDHTPDKMDERLKVEFATASADTEADEKWRTIFSSSINKEDDDSYLDSLQLSAQDLFVQRVEVTDFEKQSNSNFEQFSLDVPQEEILEQPGDLISFPTPQAVRYNPLGIQSLSKISEDENENDRDASYDQRHSNGNQNKMLPKDFCVIQETKNENVSTEHVDFQLARKQWREMEEQSKNKTAIPSTKQLSFHGSHSFMHTPVRNIEGIQKRGHDLQNLNLIADFHNSQVSPCSEDSGLDDPSYKSPHDDAETPVERKICVSMEREENLSREKGHSRMDKTTDCGPFHVVPRSVITPLTPSFIITSSPTKEPKHEGSTNNVIILETANLIIRSVSDLSLNQDCEQSQEKMFLNNPFFKLRSRSTMSLVDEEIKVVKQREEELKKERANLYGKDRFNADRMLSNHMDTLAFLNSADVPVKCKSSPSSPMKTAYRMENSTSFCDHRFSEGYAGGRRKSAMALRWEAGEFTKNY